MNQVRQALIPDAVAGYARRMHAAIGEHHHVASPLGAWLVLALAGSAAEGGTADRLGNVLACPRGTPQTPPAGSSTRPRDTTATVAVTAMGVGLSFSTATEPGRRRDALLRFDRPYAMVATAAPRHPSPERPCPSSRPGSPSQKRSAHLHEVDADREPPMIGAQGRALSSNGGARWD